MLCNDGLWSVKFFSTCRLHLVTFQSRLCSCSLDPWITAGENILIFIITEYCICDGIKIYHILLHGGSGNESLREATIDEQDCLRIITVVTQVGASRSSANSG